MKLIKLKVHNIIVSFNVSISLFTRMPDSIYIHSYFYIRNTGYVRFSRNSYRSNNSEKKKWEEKKTYRDCSKSLFFGNPFSLETIAANLSGEILNENERRPLVHGHSLSLPVPSFVSISYVLPLSSLCLITEQWSKTGDD